MTVKAALDAISLDETITIAMETEMGLYPALKGERNTYTKRDVSLNALQKVLFREVSHITHKVIDGETVLAILIY